MKNALLSLSLSLSLSLLLLTNLGFLFTRQSPGILATFSLTANHQTFFFLIDWSPKEKQHLAQELSDVLIYLVRLAEKCHIDLPKEVVAKMALNSMKYPAHLVKGSSKKYTEYKEMNS